MYDSETKTSIKNFSFTENAYSASFRKDGNLICIGFEDNNAKVFPMLDAQSKDFEQLDENEPNGTTASSTAKPKKRPLRKFDDHLGFVSIDFILIFYFEIPLLSVYISASDWYRLFVKYS